MPTRSYKTISPAKGSISGGRPAFFRPVRRGRLDRFRVRDEDLRWECDPTLLPFRSTSEVRPGRKIIGQEKAMKALRVGIEMESPGYNIFVCGLTGTGRMTAVRHVLSLQRRSRYQPRDLCFVPNFVEPERPVLLIFRSGLGRRFRRDVHGLIERARRVGERRPNEGPLPARRRAQLRSIVAGGIRALSALYPDQKVRGHLERLGRELIAREGNGSPEEMGVNLVREQSEREPPGVIPTSISHGTLFGVIEDGGGNDGKKGCGVFSGIRTGAVLEAAGGVLVLQAADLLAAKGAWPALKGCLLNRRIEIRDVDPSTGDLRSAVRPDPLPIDLKVILVGDYVTYDELFHQDPEFGDLFKIRVDFDSDVELRRGIIVRDYPAFISRIIRDEGLRHFSVAAVARMVEFGVRRAGRKKKITTQFSAVADLLREASFWAGRQGHRIVLAGDVDRALRESLDRLGLVERKMSEMILDGTILIDTSGSRIGQVNGLAVYDQGDYIFGKPSRITAETSVGQGGIINIERESGFSGKSHDKGVQILGGYLRSRFAQRRPLSLTASVCFEQCYSGVDGDSASSTEIYAILSSLSGLPIRQDLAVTGSMNQKGDIQPIGGVNEKIEGFFDCVMSGRPTGREGVIIPRRNLPDLVLREDVARAVRRGRFHIYAISKVEEGVEILTGVPAGRQRKDGRYPPGTVFDRADRRLEEIAKGLRQTE